MRAEIFNALNSPIFSVGDYDNSVNFGRVASLEVGARIVQLAVKFNF